MFLSIMVPGSSFMAHLMDAYTFKTGFMRIYDMFAALY